MLIVNKFVLLLLAVVPACLLTVSNDDDDSSSEFISAPVEEFVHGEMVRELTDSELSKIVAEQPFDDPLNGFYDPFEPFRLSTFAYWHPITFPKEHVNPPLPAGFLPLNSPPKNFPSDFFFHDDDEAIQNDEFRRLLLEEHAASFCPYLRRWREKHPLKPYPVESDFLESHPPIKFITGKGYEIDMELIQLNILSQKAQEQIVREAVENNTEEAKNASPHESKEASRVKDKKKKRKRKSIWKLDVMLRVIEKVKRNRKDCRKNYKFLDPPKQMNFKFNSLPTCMEEVIFYMDDMEDLQKPSINDRKIPDLVDKVEYYRNMLIDLNVLKVEKRRNYSLDRDNDDPEKNKNKKCPFGFKRTNSKVNQAHQGTIPKWAELSENETIYSSSDDEMENNYPTKYLFPYKQVPFPSIQDTLKKYVSI